ncbi:MAG: hypothetical protein ACK4YP_01035 [Myxococcota bacterium]
MRTLLLPLALLAACAGASGASVEPCTACALTDVNNYAYTSDLRIGTLVVPEHADATIRWDGLTRDIRGGAIDPVADLGEARLIAFRDLAPEEVAYALAHDDLEQADVGAYVTCAPEEARCALSEFGMFGNSIDIQQYFAEGYGTWLLALGAPRALGADAMVFLDPRADATATEVALLDTTSRLNVDVDLRSLAPVVVPTVEPGITLDWSGLAHDGLGDPVDPATIDEVWVGRFQEGPAELEREVFALEELAELTWTMKVDGTTSADLTDLVGETDFLGIDRQGTWVVALRCRTCTNPAPRLLTFLEAAP